MLNAATAGPGSTINTPQKKKSCGQLPAIRKAKVG